jgi:hypothetical protein
MLRAQHVNGKCMAVTDTARRARFGLYGLLAFSVLIGPHARSSESMPPRLLYDITTETVLPHLEENLRYAITRNKRCLSRQEIFFAFPILTHASLKGCKLGNENHVEDTVSYSLICEGGHGTSGSAWWHLGTDQIRGTLDVKMGGKNMTFYQRVTAKLLGECATEAMPKKQD